MNPQIEWLFNAASRNGMGLLFWSWQALALLGCVWLGVKLFRVRTPAIRHQVWLIGLIAVATAPLWGAAASKLRLPGSFPAPPYQLLQWTPPPFRNIETSGEPSGTIHKTSSPSLSLLKTKAMSALFFLWMLGAAVKSAQLLSEWRRLRRIRSRSTPTQPHELGCPDLELRGAELRLSTEIRSPFTAGVFNLMILVPADLAAWTSPEERKAILQHEQVHIDRGDTWINVLTNLMGVLFFFHPMVRYAIRRLGIEREIACDDRVVDQGADAASYAECLCKVAERCILRSGSPCGVHGMALLSAKDILEGRIEMILNQDRVRIVARQWRYVALSALLIAGVASLLVPTQSIKPGHAQTALNDGDAPPPPPPPPLPPTLSLSVVRGENPPLRNIQTPVLNLLHDLAVASMNRDSDFFVQFLDDSYEEIGPNGEVLDKAGAIAEVQKTGYEIKQFDFFNLRVFANPLGAFATFLGSAGVIVDGVESTIEYRYTVNFVRKDNEGPMTIAAMHVSSIKE